MAVRIFNLRGVPEDEAADIRELLTSHSVDYYETPAGNWGISIPAIWLNDDSERDRVRQLIDVYQEQRGANARIEYARQKSAGEHRSFFGELKEHPVRVIGYLVFALVILYFSTKPFIGLGH